LKLQYLVLMLCTIVVTIPFLSLGLS
jgi:hypothetical protein